MHTQWTKNYWFYSCMSLGGCLIVNIHKIIEYNLEVLQILIKMSQSALCYNNPGLTSAICMQMQYSSGQIIHLWTLSGEIRRFYWMLLHTHVPE